MSKKFSCWEYDSDNLMVRVFLGEKEIDGIDFETLVENWLEDSGYRRKS